MRNTSVTSRRLQYAPVDLARLDAFHGLVQDDHVRRYLLDGKLLPIQWTEARVRDSQRLFAERGVGLWLAHDRQSGDLVGFCGFLEVASMHPELQLVYALFERFTGQGLATEMAQTVVDEALRHPGFERIFASVDAANQASCRVLDKLGFERVRTERGSFGDLFLMRRTGSVT